MGRFQFHAALRRLTYISTFMWRKRWRDRVGQYFFGVDVVGASTSNMTRGLELVRRAMTRVAVHLHQSSADKVRLYMRAGIDGFRSSSSKAEMTDLSMNSWSRASTMCFRTAPCRRGF